MRRETKRRFLVGTVILGFLSIFKKRQASSPFEALNSTWLFMCQVMWGPLSRWSGDLGLSLGSPQAFQSSLLLSDERRACILAPAGKSDLLSNQCISLSTPLEATKWGSLSHTYCWWKAPLEVLVESWPTSSIESWESALFPRRYGVHGAFLDSLCWNCSSYRLERGFSGNLCSRLKELKPFFVFDAKRGIALGPMLANRASFRVGFGYAELFHIPAVTSVSF